MIIKNGGLLGGGGVYLPMETTGNDGSGISGAGSVCETRQQCISRRTQIAEQRRRSCRLDAVAVFLMVAGISIGGSALIALITGTETLGVGAIAALIGGGIGVTIAVVNLTADLSQCNSTAANYIQDSPDICGAKPETCP